MKILLTNHQLAEPAGTETAAYTLAKALRSRGHTVMLATSRRGLVSEVLESEGFEVTLDPKDWAGRGIDVVHACHSTMAILARARLPNVPMIFHGHGVLPFLERPPSVDVGVSAHVVVSEEVKDAWSRLYGIQDAVLIRNAVDAARFRPLRPVSPRLKRVLVISNRIPRDTVDVIEQACRRVGARLSLVGVDFGIAWDTEAKINDADLVITIGRGALEAMACGRVVLLLDACGGDGLVTPENYPELRRFNFSGRRYGREYDVNALADEMAAYDSALGEAGRELVLENHDISKIVESYEEVYRSASAAGGPSGRVPPVPADEILFYQRELTKCLDEIARLGIYERSYNYIVNKPIVRAYRFLKRLVTGGASRDADSGRRART